MINKVRKLKKQKGFTLVELLVVLVILGILAATIIPRMVAQTKGAENAEAVNMLGTMRRAASNSIDAGVAVTDFGFDAAGALTGSAASMGFAALQNPRFSYAYSAATGIITATKTVGGGIITMDINANTIGCAGGLTALTDPSGKTVGCR